jgi:hypothetical protein
MEGGQTYRYRPLDESRNEMRLLRIKSPGSDYSVLRGFKPNQNRLRTCIDHVSLDERPTYVALSYTWGDSQRREIIVEENGKEYEILVGENLYEALSSISPVYAILWADAICKFVWPLRHCTK